MFKKPKNQAPFHATSVLENFSLKIKTRPL